MTNLDRAILARFMVFVIAGIMAMFVNVAGADSGAYKFLTQERDSLTGAIKQWGKTTP